MGRRLRRIARKEDLFALSLLPKRVVSEEVASAGVRGSSLGPEALRGDALGPAHLLVRRHPAWSNCVRRHVLGWNTHWPGVATHIIWWTVGSRYAHVRISHVWIVVHGSRLPAHHVWIASL